MTDLVFPTAAPGARRDRLSAARARWRASPLALIGAASLWLATVGNAALWRALAEAGGGSGPRAAWFAGMLGLSIGLLVAALLALVAWRRILKPAVCALLVIGAIGLHFMWSYRVVLDPAMLTNVLQTDSREAGDLLGPGFVAVLVASALLPGWLVWRWRIDYGPWRRRLARNAGAFAGCLATALLLLGLNFQALASTMRNHVELRYLISPFNALWSLGSASAAPLERARLPLLPVGRDASLGAARTPGARPPLLVLVVGETARGDHFSLNGYARPTNPELARLDVVSQRHASACGTSTAVSLPCMFSDLGRVGFARRTSERENLLDVLQHAGLAVLWVDNQAGCKGVCARLAGAVDPAPVPAPARAECPDAECPDETMLDGLDARIAALPAAQRARGVVVVLHAMGSHGPAYYKRSPPELKRFRPECEVADLQRCSTASIVAAYDNSLLATDRFLAATIGWAARQGAAYDPGLLYVSDHGESLGENGIFLHGLPYAVAPEAQKHVAWILWTSNAMQRRSALDAGCLASRRDRPVSHDDYFHGVLGLLDVRTSAYRPERDPYRDCRPASDPAALAANP